MIKPPNQATIYNEKRRIIFSTYNKDPDKARAYLEGYKNVLDNKGFIGLKAELDFFSSYENEFKLTLAADVGDASDFVGIIGTDMYRIDVTTNEEFKKLESYEKFQQKGHKYKIAVVDSKNGDLQELIDINFPFCYHCGDNRLFDIALLLPEHIESPGSWSSTFDQVLVEYCPACGFSREKNRLFYANMWDFSELYEHIEEENYKRRSTNSPLLNAKDEVSKHALEINRFLKKEFDTYLAAIGSNRYVISNPRDGDGFHETYFEWISSIVMSYIPEECGYELATL